MGLVVGLLIGLVGSGVIAVGKWFETKRSGFFHNFVLSVCQLSRPIERAARVEVGRLELFFRVSLFYLVLL